MPKPSKSERREDQIKNLERENKNLKKENIEIQQKKMVKLDDEQLQKFLDDLTQRMECSTSRAVDEITSSISVDSQEQQRTDGFSYVIKWSIAILFFVVTLLIVYLLCSIWSDFWNAAGWVNRVALFVVAFAGVDCAILGFEILKEKDRNYIVSLFSALVALVALIVTLVK